MNVTLLNIDGVYRNQTFYQNSSHQWINFDFLRNINLFCEKELVGKIRKMVVQQPNDIYFLGNGNYHYFSYILQSQIDKPYSLVLFDHHTDTLPSPSDELLSCGSWVLESLKNLPMLKKAYIIGVSEEAVQHIPNSIQDKIVLYTERMFQTNLRSVLKSILKTMPTNMVYISVDKDVLYKKDAVTNWDHGTLRIKQLLKMIKTLFQHKIIIGSDVCGEVMINPSNEYSQEIMEAIAINNRANGLILEAMKWWSKKGKISPAVLHA
ncbi:arginase family protein [Ornithinibacillus halotolerans]|uniref:Arginase n=1 Tax=Ornithinibacillus halotolerans TaxID=1274357 RepID=A0A916RVR8_9BACI|nr:arginase family protein [Ornithinibacillus halotolerans]GGA72530.1 arginase [Ornithinibacillus halotolerans]